MRMDDRSLRVLPPILRNKHCDLASAFTPESLLRVGRRQKDVPNTPVPEICVLDPDGDIVRHLRAAGRSRPVAGWACYHSMMDCFGHGGGEYGIVGCAAGTSYAVPVAEQLFASGCRVLLSITSSGQVTTLGPPPYFILIERAPRDEGTSYHYLPPDSEFAEADPGLLVIAESALANMDDPVESGATWTTDTPYRETLEAIGCRTDRGNSGCRDGGSRSLRLRGSTAKICALLRACHQSAGPIGARPMARRRYLRSFAQSERPTLPLSPNFRSPDTPSAATRQSDHAQFEEQEGACSVVDGPMR
jgi:phosphorylase superfamily protein